jgi:PPOX class probable F420-dependent enzyme
MVVTMSIDIPEAARVLLEQPLVVDLATVRPDGGPQVNPMWFLFEDGLIWFTHTNHRQKFKNLQNEPRVAISIKPADNPYSYLEVRGIVDHIEPDPEGELYSRLSVRYGQGPVTPPDTQYRVKLAVRPTSFSGYALLQQH